MDLDNQKKIVVKDRRKRKRVPIGRKVFLGMAGILVVVLLGTIFFWYQLSKLNSIIQKSSAGTSVVGFSHKIKKHLNQEQKNRVFYKIAEGKQSSLDEINDFALKLDVEISRVRKNNDRTPEIIKQLEQYFDSYHTLAESLWGLYPPDSALSIEQLPDSGSLGNYERDISELIEAAANGYKFGLDKSDFTRIIRSVREFSNPLYYSAWFYQESQTCSLYADSLFLVSNSKDSIVLQIPVLVDSLGNIFTAEIAAAQEHDSLWSPVFSTLTEGLDSVITRELADVTNILDESNRAMVSALKTGLLGTIGLFILGLVISAGFIKKILSPIASLRAATFRARRGEWDREIPITTSDEIGDLTADFNAMLIELAELDRMKSRFLASITHDLKSPIGRVKGNIANLQDELLGPITPGQDEMLDMMSRDVKKLSRLIYDILDLQKMKAGAFKLELNKVNMEEFLLGVLEQHAMDFLDKEVTMGVKFDLKNVNVTLDSKQIERVIDNLITNALKYTDPDGKIVIESYIEDNDVVVKVIDTGVGIPDEYLQHVFDQFYQVQGKRKVKGTGLGLTIAKELVEAHGGRIWADSKLNIGTYFAFAIPAKGPEK